MDRYGRGKLFILCCLFLTNISYGVVSTRSNCSKEFYGKVASIQSIETPFFQQALQKEKVQFEVIEVLKGTVGDVEEIAVLKHGPNKFKEGETYRVGLNGEWLCSVVND